MKSKKEVEHFDTQEKPPTTEKKKKKKKEPEP